MIRLKNETEINKIKDSSAILAETFKKLGAAVDEGITTGELDHIAHSYITKCGATPAFLGYLDYPASICASVNEIVIHGIPDEKKLRRGDILSLDLGVDLSGYISDAAYTYTVGEVPEHTKQLLKVTEECLYRGIEKAKAGNRIHHISQAVYNHAKEHQYGVVHQFCGHGVGFELHEDPQVPNYAGRGPNPRIKAGMVLAIEPMINMGTDEVVVLEDDWTVMTVDSSLSAHFEHTIAVLPDRTEILTNFS
ncbi:MAG: type I methionyl aminopeptidase [Spirochaetales bacterium]|nr:type I methionyl aminopeptidase [Spirochaetales bacterium]